MDALARDTAHPARPFQWTGLPTAVVGRREVWMDVQGVAIHGTWFTPKRVQKSVGILVIGGIAHEEQTMSLGLVALSRALAAQSNPVLLVELSGTAQSAEYTAGNNQAEQWQSEIRAGAEALHRIGCDRLVVVAARHGALLAAAAFAESPVSHLIVWSPVLSGRRSVKEMRLLQSTSGEDHVESYPGITIGGSTLTPDQLDSLKRLEFGSGLSIPAEQITIFEAPERVTMLRSRIAEHLQPRVTFIAAPETDRWLLAPSDLSVVPFDDFDILLALLAGNTATDGSTTDGSESNESESDTSESTTVLLHRGVAIRETFLRFGSFSLGAVLSEPVSPDSCSESAGQTAVKGHNSATVAVSTVGPGRLLLDFARGEAARGRPCLRFDLSGFGLSDFRTQGAWADHYDHHSEAEIDEAVQELVRRGYTSISVLGYCSGAWAALHTTEVPELQSIVAINPQMYVRGRFFRRKFWPGLKLHDQLIAHLCAVSVVKRALIALEVRTPFASPMERQLRTHSERGTAVWLLFGSEDFGLKYLSGRAGRVLRARGDRHAVEVREFTGLGHLPGGPTRDRMLDEIHEILDRADNEPGSITR